MTISGGEPMSQLSFTLALLRRAKSEGIHTCIDTSGYAPRSGFEKVIQYAYLFLFDYKITKSDDHLKLTGVNNQLILENLDYLYKQNMNIRLRCPIIPGINDTSEHHDAILKLEKKYPNIEK